MDWFSTVFCFVLLYVSVLFWQSEIYVRHNTQRDSMLNDMDGMQKESIMKAQATEASAWVTQKNTGPFPKDFWLIPPTQAESLITIELINAIKAPCCMRVKMTPVTCLFWSQYSGSAACYKDSSKEFSLNSYP